ncbi:hypothetical protein FF096_23185 [Micromonospora sp. CP22]|nr:hypothetical protein [Micromonospora sp. CP22]
MVAEQGDALLARSTLARRTSAAFAVRPRGKRSGAIPPRRGVASDSSSRGGGCRSAISLLRRTVAEHPIREPALVLLMTALHRRGDIAGAISVFRSAARVLQDELGVEPGSDLRRLYQGIIKHRVLRLRLP